MAVRVNVLFSLYICLLFSFSIWGSTSNIENHENWKFLPKECGLGSSADRIIGGLEASLGQFPWIARLAYRNINNRSDYVFGCGGAILNNWYVITAAHCVVGSLRRRVLFVRLGENFINEDIDCEDDICAPKPQDISWRTIIKYRTYPNIEGVTVIGDLALIRLRHPIRFNEFVQPICLPTNSIVENITTLLKEGESVEVAGWGAINAITLSSANKLMYVELTVEKLDQCRKIYEDKIDDTQICIGKGGGMPLALTQYETSESIAVENTIPLLTKYWTNKKNILIRNGTKILNVPVLEHGGTEMFEVRNETIEGLSEINRFWNQDKGKDTCVGDSGGPVMKPFAFDGPPRYYLVAIVSYGVKWCGTASAIYTNVSHYMEWILDRVIQ